MLIDHLVLLLLSPIVCSEQMNHLHLLSDSMEMNRLDLTSDGSSTNEGDHWNGLVSVISTRRVREVRVKGGPMGSEF